MAGGEQSQLRSARMAPYLAFVTEDFDLRDSSANSGFPAGNPIANVLVIIVGALAIGASIVLGFFAFVIVGSIVLIMASIIGLRVWWLKKKFGGQIPRPDGNTRRQASGVIEGEYKVVDDDRKGE